jgi:hypothetical protein
MCCLRYEHDFYVQSRKRFPKEGKIFTTSLGEEKVVSVDIFRERITLRGVEGEVRMLPLADFKAETEQLAGAAVVVANGDEEESAAEGIHPEEISPELLYTAEHPVFTPGAAPTPAPNGNGRPRESDGRDEGPGGNKRRRGRRGGRRGRGGDGVGGNGGGGGGGEGPNSAGGR